MAATAWRSAAPLVSRQQTGDIESLGVTADSIEPCESFEQCRSLADDADYRPTQRAAVAPAVQQPMTLNPVG